MCVCVCVCTCGGVCCRTEDHLDCGQSERAVGTETEKAGLNRLPEGRSVQHSRLQPPPLDFLSLSLSLSLLHTHTCTHTHTHTHPSSWEVPGGSEAHWLIRSQVKHCPGACYKAKVNDDTHTHTHTHIHVCTTTVHVSPRFLTAHVHTHTDAQTCARLLSLSDSCSCSLLTTGISLYCIWYNDIIPSICWVVRHHARRLTYEIGVKARCYFRIRNGYGVGLIKKILFGLSAFFCVCSSFNCLLSGALLSYLLFSRSLPDALASKRSLQWSRL